MERHGGMPLANFPVDWDVASDSGFRDVVAKGTHLARPELADSVHVEAAGWQPDRHTYYRFTAGDRKSGAHVKSVSVGLDTSVRRLRKNTTTSDSMTITRST